jgi:hypothetical protein
MLCCATSCAGKSTKFNFTLVGKENLVATADKLEGYILHSVNQHVLEVLSFQCTLLSSVE